MTKKEDKLVVVYKAQGEMEAQVVKTKLESSGIPAMLKSLAAPSIHAFVLDGMGEYKVMVPESYLDDALKVINEI
jgi:hypothetical protein